MLLEQSNIEKIKKDAADKLFVLAKIADLQFETKKGEDYIKQALQLDPDNEEIKNFKFISWAQ